MKKSFISILILLSVISFSACKLEVGMGASVDLEAPVISVTKMKSGENTIKTSFETSIYCNKDVIFYGTAEDNQKVSNVKAEIKWAEDEAFNFLGNATLDGNDWTLKLSLNKEGACSIKFTAEDSSGNYGTKSSKVVTLFVDNDPPVDDSWYIDRLNNGIQYSMQSLNALKNIISEDANLTHPSNIDVAQNVEFDICSAFSDSSGIKNVFISIYDESGKKVVEKIPNVAQNNYAPKFHITHEMLVNANSALATGMHYLQVRYTAEDTVTDPGANTVQDKALDIGWFIWWPESDNPKYSISDLKKDSLGHEYIALPISSSLTITVFDDDCLSNTMSCEFFDNQNQSKGRSEAVAKANEREHVLSLKAPDIPQELHLIINTEAVSGTALQNVSIPVKVTDESIPDLIITQPENNKIPGISGSLSDPEITFAGITLDKANCKYLEFVWVPDSVATDNKNSKATKWLDYRVQNSLPAEPSENISDPIYGEGEFAGMKLWSIKLTESPSNPGDVLKEKSFSFNLKLKTDFVCNGVNEQTHDKYFLIRLIREDGNYSDSELKLTADSLEPEIEPVYPAGNMSIVDNAEPLTIQFKASKESGLPLEKCELYYVPADGSDEQQIPLTPDNQELHASGTTFVAQEISSSTLSGYLANNENPRYRYYAKDILGNEKSETLQFIISSKPSLQSINSTAPSKCKIDDEILINVSFSKSVTVNANDKPKIKLLNITRENYNGEFYADYVSGSGSTTLVFSYKVKEGDSSSGVGVDNPAAGPLILNNPDTLGAYLNTLTSANNLQSKRSENPITIDGIKPVVDEIELQTAVDATNLVDNIKYLRAGRTVTATVTVSEKVTVQGSPTFVVNVGSGDDTIELPWQRVYKVSDDVNDTQYNLEFSKKIESTDANGEITYNKASCLVDFDVIKDDYSNSLENNLDEEVTPNFYIDTTIPQTPEIKNSSNTALFGGQFNNSVSFSINNPSENSVDKAFDSIQYSINGGSSWINYTSGTVTLEDSASLVSRIKDNAGNVSSVYAGPINIEINKAFPDFSVECTNPDGYYKAETTLEFKVNFTAPVNIPESSGNTRPYVEFTNSRKAYITQTAAQNKVTSATFTYITKNTDDFTVSVATTGVKLTGVTDEYGNSQGTKTLADAYTRSGIHCDSITPKVINMVPGGSKGNNIYDNSQATTITLTFNEPVQLGNGMLYLRQVEGWAIPPVLTASEFNTICNSFPASSAETYKNILSVQENGIDMEDSAWDNNSEQRNNIGYHGTGQYIGPYKKSSQGVDDSGNPDISTKYVLDFDMDIWETIEEHFYDKTFEPKDGAAKLTESYEEPKTNKRTANDIRAALEKVHYHERYMSAASAQINGSTVVLNFPAGLFGDTALPYGRKWELVIEKGSFMDAAGNKFGADADGSISMKDSVQTATGTGTSGLQTDDFGTWGRGRTIVTSGEKPVVLIKTVNNEYFWSDKVAVPVIRVDRYSYGNGIFQSDASGLNQTQIGLEGSCKTIPSCYVRVRVDCETEGATITYKSLGAGKTVADVGDSVYSSRGYRDANTYLTTTDSVLGDISLDSGTTVSPDPQTGITPQIIFALGSGTLDDEEFDDIPDYKISYKGYVKAKSTKTNYSANTEIAKEGVFQTVVYFDNPQTGNTSLAESENPFSIRGTTGLSGEPTISPFPLRDNQLLSPFIRHAYKERTSVDDSNDYYWVSYEILVDSCFSGHASYDNNSGQWISQWGLMKPGEFTQCTSMQTW